MHLEKLKHQGAVILHMLLASICKAAKSTVAFIVFGPDWL